MQISIFFMKIKIYRENLLLAQISHRGHQIKKFGAKIDGWFTSIVHLILAVENVGPLLTFNGVLISIVWHFCQPDLLPKCC